MESTAGNRESARERILDAALDCAADDGIASLTNRRIAARASVSLGTLTYHFNSQEEVLHEAMTRFVAAEVQRLETIQNESAGDDPQVALVAVQKLLSGDSGRRIAKFELYAAAARDERLRAGALRCYEAYDAVVAKGLTSIGIEPSEVVVRSTVALIDGLQLRRLALAEDQLEIAEAAALLLAGARAAEGGPG